MVVLTSRGEKDPAQHSKDMIVLRIELAHTNKKGYGQFASKVVAATNKQDTGVEVTFLDDDCGITFMLRTGGVRRISAQRLTKVIIFMQEYLYNFLPAIDRYKELEILD